MAGIQDHAPKPPSGCWTFLVAQLRRVVLLCRAAETMRLSVIIALFTIAPASIETCGREETDVGVT